MNGRRVQSCLLIDVCVTCAILYCEGNTKEGVSKGASRMTLVRVDIFCVRRSINDLEDLL